MKPCYESNLKSLKLIRRGKVRDIYEYGDDKLLILTTDRLSAFDVVLPTPIPHKGAVLNMLSKFWYNMVEDLVPNHFILDDPLNERLEKDEEPGTYRRSMIVIKANMFNAECIVRGYMAGSAWKEYQENGTVCKIKLPPGLRNGDRLPEPIFTPSTKADEGHDINISFAHFSDLVNGTEVARKLRDLTIEIYKRVSDHALERGIIVADGKLEFGMHDGKIILCDEVFTPDSSRFWPVAEYVRNMSNPPSFDKQYIRDYLESIDFNKQPPGPELPEDVVEATSEKYLKAYKLLTEIDLTDYYNLDEMEDVIED